MPDVQPSLTRLDCGRRWLQLDDARMRRHGLSLLLGATSAAVASAP
jgi:hypothetical protein